MGSVTFDSQDGSSRVHDHVITDIRTVKGLLPEDEDVVLSLGQGFFEDYTWIAGEDRAYFAARLRSVLDTDPPGEWSFRGLNRFDTPEALAFAASCAETGTRVPGLHSIIEHLETNSDHPVVITNSVTACFPSLGYWPQYLNNREKDGGDYDDYADQLLFEGLSAADRWESVWPEFIKRHADKRWTRGATPAAASLRAELKANGFWRNKNDRNDFEDGVFGSASMADLTARIRPSLVTFATGVIENLAPLGKLYVLGETATFKVACEPIARRYEDRLVGIGFGDIRIAYGESEIIGRLGTYHCNGYCEPVSDEMFTAVLCTPILASADILIDLVDLALPERTGNPLLIIAGLANSHQARIAEKELLEKGGPVTLRACETVDFDITATWRHGNQLRYSKDIHAEPTSRWLFERQTRYYASLRKHSLKE